MVDRLVFCPERAEMPIPLAMGEQKGDKSFGCNSRFLEKDGMPWLPVMAEFHFTRYDEAEWELELRKIKAAGVDIVSSYLFWIFYEEEQGVFRFDKKRDIAHFLELCRKVGLYAFMRIGPWCHGECRNGGFPDWLQHSGVPLRCNDEEYLRLVRRLFSAYADEIKPYLFRNGGTVIGIQLENELPDNGAHLEELKRIALSCGLEVPYYTVTGWGPRVTEFPEGQMLPVFGCYPAAPWEGHTRPLGVNKNYFFSTLRNDSSIGNDRISGKASDDESILKNIPHLTCELGPGNQLTYLRRPTIKTEDVISLATVSLGSGNCLPGYYMFHGGFNPPEGLYQESKASGYTNDLPVSSYDFQAPLDEYGQPRESYFYFRRLHQFIHCCEASLAQMTCTAPDVLPESENDNKTPRMYFRGNTKGGYLFYNTHQRNARLSPVKNLIVCVQYEKELCSYGPVDICEGSYGVMPVRQKLQGAEIEFMTLMPLWSGVYKNKPSFVCCIQSGISPVIELTGNVQVKNAGMCSIKNKNGNTLISIADVSKSITLEIVRDGIGVDIIVLCEEDSLYFNAVNTKNGTEFVIKDGIVFEDKGKILSFEKTEKSLPEKCVRLHKAENLRIGAENMYAQFLFAEADECPEYILEVSASLSDICYDAIFSFDVCGDVIQLYADDMLIADDFLRAKQWRVSLRRLLPYIRKGCELRIKCSPVSENRDVYLDEPLKSRFSPPVLTDIYTSDIVEINI